ALPRKSVLPTDHHGLHRRHHVVAGGWPARALQNSPRGWRRVDRDRGERGRRLHDRPDRLAGNGMEFTIAAARRNAEGKTARIRPPACALAGIAEYARRPAGADFVPDAEIRMGAA